MLDPSRRHFLKQSLAGAAVVSLAPHVLAASYRPPRAVKVAVVGCGRQGRDIAKELGSFENVELVAMVDVVERRLAAALRRQEGAKGYASTDEMLKAEPAVEAVFVASSTYTHRPIVEACLAAGKAVYCEAPLAHTAEDTRAIAAAAAASTAVFQTGLLASVNPIYKLANKFFRSGSIRDVQSLRAASFRKNSWRASGSEDLETLDWKLDPKRSNGLPGELATHQIDSVSWFCDRVPVSVRGWGSVRFYKDGRDLADSTQLVFDFGDGVRMLHEAGLANSFESTNEVVRGSNGTFKLAWTAGWLFKEADAETQGWEVYANRQQFHDEQGITIIADATKLASQDRLKDGVGLPNTPLWYGIEAFLKSVTEGAEVVNGAQRGALATIAGIAAQHAVLTGEEVAIEA
ncbi:MAG: Gfo/Idh/MocA family oxidoreductase [Planctomycetota bacterium]